eukprot:scaffold3234_cov166-Amphora_coffeaeformis.AAC.13
MSSPLCHPRAPDKSCSSRKPKIRATSKSRGSRWGATIEFFLEHTGIAIVNGIIDRISKKCCH